MKKVDMARYKVVIADDRPDVVEGLACLVPWQDLECQVVGTVFNGRKALELVKEQKPDILITDIKMPIMGGLELAEECRKMGDQIRIIVLSGYDDFSYAQRSIRLGVDEYLLKPVKIEEMCETVKRITNGLKKEKRCLEKDNYFWALAVGNSPNELSQIEETFRMLKIRIPVKNLRLAIVELKDYLEIEETKGYAILENYISLIQKGIGEGLEEHCFWETFRFSLDKIAVLFSPKVLEEAGVEVSYEEILKDLISQLEIRIKLQIGLGMSSEMETARKLPEAFQQAEEALDRYSKDFKTPEMKVFGKRIDYRNMEERLIHEIRTGNQKGVREILDEFFRYNNGVSQEDLRKGIQEIYMVVKHYAVPEMEGENTWKRPPQKAEELKEWLFQACCRMLEELKTMQAGQMETYVKEVKYFVEKHYGDNISLGIAAQLVALTPAYLSAVFKEGMGMTFTDYLLEVRIRRAKELLKQKQLKIYEVAQAVGYGDVRYFGELFKKKTGMTPKEYQNS